MKTDMRESGNIFKILEKSFLSGKLPHAIIFYGANENFVTKNVFDFACKILNTKDLASNPDCFIVRPVNKTRQIGVEEMRELLINVQKSSFSAKGFKICIICESDRMSRITSNILLKTLEEPPEQTYFFLITSRLGDFLPTILSRCLHFEVHGTDEQKISDPNWVNWLQRYEDWQKRLWNNDFDSIFAFEAIGLIDSWQKFFDFYGETILEREKENISENLTEESLAAIQVGLKKRFARLLFTEIEERNHSIFCDFPEILCKLTEKLEECYRLHVLNVPEVSIVENYLLSVVFEKTINV